MRTLQRLLFGIGSCWGMTVVVACGPNDGTALTRSSEVSSADRQSATRTVERFDCADLQEVRVRFSAPGFVDATHVGLYYNYIGLPAGEKHLEIEWDEEAEPEIFERVDLGPGEVQRFNNALFDLKGIVEHNYQNKAHPERFVRGTPQPPVLPPQAWINPPLEKTTLHDAAEAPSRGGVHTWGTPFFCFTQRDLDRC